MDLRRGQHALQLRHHPGEGGQGTERRLLARDLVTGRAVQPAASGINKARSLRLRGKRGQQGVDQAAIDRAHIGVEIAGHVNDRVERREFCNPRFGDPMSPAIGVTPN